MEEPFFAIPVTSVLVAADVDTFGLHLEPGWPNFNADVYGIQCKYQLSSFVDIVYD